MRKSARALKERQKYIVCVAPSVLDRRLLRSRGGELASLALAPGYLIPRLWRFKPSAKLIPRLWRFKPKCKAEERSLDTRIAEAYDFSAYDAGLFMLSLLLLPMQRDRDAVCKREKRLSNH